MEDQANLAALDQELNQMIQKGDILGAFEKFYADDVEMQENADPPFKGKAANWQREKAFVESVAQVHKIELLGSAAGQGVTYSEWMMDITYKNGSRAASHQVSARRWKNGQVIGERFYYNKH